MNKAFIKYMFKKNKKKVIPPTRDKKKREVAPPLS